MVTTEANTAPPAATSAATALLGAADPAPFQRLNPSGTARCLVVADHAGNAVPAVLNGLGLAPAMLERHIALDRGSRAVATGLAQRLDARALLANYSRLVVDLNRQLDDPTAFAEISDGLPIPGNQALDAAQRKQRQDAVYHPYHDAIDNLVDEFLAQNTAPAIVSIHSFTPRLDGQDRPWHAGVLWDRDPRIARPLLERLRRRAGLVVGDNEPYSGRHAADYTIDHHAEARGLPNASIEIRQDLIEDAAGVRRWAEILFEDLAPILADGALYRPLDGPGNGRAGAG